ncbi:lipopolysaccharide biosynthesis protein [Spirosoma knui]
MELKKILLRNTFASAWGKLSVVIFRVLQIPLFLHSLSVEDFGRWMVIYSLPAWLQLASLGFGSVGANELAMAHASGELKKAREVFSTSLLLTAIISLIGTVLIGVTVYIVPICAYLGIDPSRRNELSLTVIYLTISVFISFSNELFGGRLRAGRKAHYYIALSSFRPWLELLVTFIILRLTTRFDILALGILASTIVHSFALQIISVRALPSIKFSSKDADFTSARFLFRKGMAFQAIPLGHALIFQGNLFVVQGILGPIAVATFSTVRTLVRSANQVLELINQVIWPEINILIGEGNFSKAARLHRTGVFASIALSYIGVLILAVFGQTIYSLWTGSTIELPQALLLVFLLPIPFNALWYTSSVVHMACNRHEGLASRYLGACLLSILVCSILSYSIGLYGAAISTLIVDLIMIPYVLNKSFQLTNDNWRSFTNGIYVDTKLTYKQLKTRFLNNVTNKALSE